MLHVTRTTPETAQELAALAATRGLPVEITGDGIRLRDDLPVDLTLTEQARDTLALIDLPPVLLCESCGRRQAVGIVHLPPEPDAEATTFLVCQDCRPVNLWPA